MFKNIDYDLIGDIIGWTYVSFITVWMAINFFRTRRDGIRKFGKGWQKKLRDRY